MTPPSPKRPIQLTDWIRAAGLPAELRGDAEVRALTLDSRRCGPGTAFLAVRGSSEDGHRYIPAAVEAGCAAVLCEDLSAVPETVPAARLDCSRRAAGPLAQALYGWPSRRMKTVGITGTNGKTTTAYLLRSLLESLGRKTAMFGTVRYHSGRRSVEATTTTPDPVLLAALAAEALDAGCTDLVMEVSSHALDQDRAAGMDFDAGVFTNLSGDHLDYHRSMEAYAAAKRRLFEGLKPSAVAVLNRDDPAAETMASAAGGEVLWYGLSEAADLSARVKSIDAGGSRFALRYRDESVSTFTPLIGRHNIYNALAAVAAAAAVGCEPAELAAALPKATNVPGRLQRVESDAGPHVFVDYAHTDDALENVLAALRPVTAGRLTVVFGCGGDRDRTKRPRMAAVAERLADRVVVTSDNPRSERPEAIIEEICAGFADRSKVVVEADRAAAIARALRDTAADDVVLIAGKGHETYQIIGTRRLAFDDAAVAAELLREASRCGR